MIGIITELKNKLTNKIVLRKNKAHAEQITIFGRILLHNYGSFSVGKDVTIISEFQRNVVGGYPNTKLYVKSA